MDESAPSPPPDRSDPADDAPVPVLDPAVDAQVRALLADAPDPGPMPEAVASRIGAAIAEAARLRIDPGPLAAGDRAVPDDGLAEVVSLPPRTRRRPLQLAAAVAAAAVVVAAGASALHVTQRPNGAAIVGDTPSATAPVGGATGGTADGRLHIQLSATAYDAASLATRARELLDHPGPPVSGMAAESPGVGPIATPIGLTSCLSALGADGASEVWADLATFAGRPAAIVVATLDGRHTAWAVERSCAQGQPGILLGATPVP